MKSNEFILSIDINHTSSLEDIMGYINSFNDIPDGINACVSADNDTEFEKVIHILKALCEKTSLPVFVGGRMTCLEDIKKYFYAGVRGIVFSKKDDLLRESHARFGKHSGDIHSTKSDISWNDLKKDDRGLIPCIVQDAGDNTVLMMAYMNEASFNETINTGRMNYFSRSRNRLWLKGEESGHFQFVKSLTTDCDKDTLLAKVEQVGVACHTGARSCFFNDIIGYNDFSTSSKGVLGEVYSIIVDRKNNPKEGSYTNYLFDKGIDKVLKKVGEEASEIIIAAKNPSEEEIIYEIADFLYHVSVLMAMKNITWEDILKELKNR